MASLLDYVMLVSWSIISDLDKISTLCNHWIRFSYLNLIRWIVIYLFILSLCKWGLSLFHIYAIFYIHLSNTMAQQGTITKLQWHNKGMITHPPTTTTKLWWWWQLCTRNDKEFGRRNWQMLNIEVHHQAEDAGHELLIGHYFNNPPMYPPVHFRRRFCMKMSLFDMILEGVVQFDNYFVQKPDAMAKLGFSPQVKPTAGLRRSKLRIFTDCRNHKGRGIGKVFPCNHHHVRAYIPSYTNVCWPLQTIGERTMTRFPNMLRSLDCMHWEWINCLVAYHGAYTGGYNGCARIILEAMALFDSWIWHFNFGMPSLHNDLNVLYSSPLFNDILDGCAPSILFYVNGKEYSQRYFYFMLTEKNIVRNTIFHIVFIRSRPPSSNQS